MLTSLNEELTSSTNAVNWTLLTLLDDIVSNARSTWSLTETYRGLFDMLDPNSDVEAGIARITVPFGYVIASAERKLSSNINN